MSKHQWHTCLLLLCCYHILTLSVIYYWTGSGQLNMEHDLFVKCQNLWNSSREAKILIIYWELQKEYLNQQFFFQFQKTKKFYSWLAPIFIHNYVSISIKLDTWGYSGSCISFINSLHLFAVLLLICSCWWPTVCFLIDCSTSFSCWLFISEMDWWDTLTLPFKYFYGQLL